VLEALLEAYEGSPIVVHGLLILECKKLIEIIQTLTQADKVEILADEVIGCACSHKSYMAVSKIFCIVDTKRLEFKVQFNEQYSLLVRHGVSLKMVKENTN
jgi:phosphatidylglycerophosphatase A